MKFLIFSLAVIAAARTVCAENEYPANIPEAIRMCYEDKFISNRYNRLPHSMDNLISIIRKIEAHPDTEFWSMAKLTGTILRRFRHDGIIDEQAVTSPDVVPIKRDRVESDKYSLIWQVIPGSASLFPETALTQQEKCSLHWMLSYAVNSTQRLEEKPRQAPRMVEESPQEPPTSDADQPQHHVSSHDIHESAESKVDMPTQDIEMDFEEVEHSAEGRDNTSDEESDKKDFFGSDDEESPPAPEPEHDHSAEHESSYWKRQAPVYTSVPQSANPLQLGVVTTKWGTVAAGVVLAGIATGLEPETALLKSLIKAPELTNQLTESSLQRNVVSNWAATLSGEMAQTALLRVPFGKTSVGPRGRWNCSICSRENVLPTSDRSMMTYAELYGGIDGLLMSHHIQKWDNNYMKLSHVLEMYYSEQGVYGDSHYRACNRVNNFRSIDQNILKEQALSSALIYFAHGMEGSPSISSSVKPVDVIGNYVNTSYTQMMNFLTNNAELEQDYTPCQGAPTDPQFPIPATPVDVTVVIDQFTTPADINNQKEMIAKLATLLDVKPSGSRIEVVSGKDGTPYLTLGNSTNKAELACKIMGLDLKYSERRLSDVFGRLRTSIAKERSFERINKVSGSNARVVLVFVASWQAASAEKDKMKVELDKLGVEMSDVNLMFVTLASAEEFRPFVKNFDRDVIKMQSLDYKNAQILVDKLSLVPARLLYPACSEKIQTAEATYVHDAFVNPNTVQYFRLGAEHFFSSQIMILRFKSAFGVNKVCWSRTNDRPGLKDTCTNALKANETVEFPFTAPCARLPSASSCPPIYLAVTPIAADDGIDCSDKRCHAPDQVMFTFSHEGLRCTSGVSSAVSSASMFGVLLLTWLISKIA